jgi:hypothetical protein
VVEKIPGPMGEAAQAAFVSIAQSFSSWAAAGLKPSATITKPACAG